MSVHVEILATGDELLTGQIVDTNSPWLMDRLWDLGVMVRRKILVGDDRDDLDAALRDMTARADVVVMCGGLGPTEDDLTAERVAAAAGVPLVVDEGTLRWIEERFRKFGRTMTPNNAKQARVPRGAEVIPNRHGTAPGFAATVGRALVVCLPGPPPEFRGLCEEWLLPRIAERAGTAGVAARLVKLFAVPESHADRILAAVRGLFGDTIFAEGKDELANLVVARLAARGERVAIAESCTGGLAAELLTRVSGASAVFDLGVVAYANAMKERILGVPAAVLAAHGAVSEPVARALAEGARRTGGASWGIGITGIAGPTGGTPEKPVGTVHVALAGPQGTNAVERLYRGDRERIRRIAAYEALNLLRLAMR